MTAARSQLRILLVYPEPPFAPGGGIATFLRHALAAHVGAGHEVHLLTWAVSDEPLHAQVLTDADLWPLTSSQVTLLRLDLREVLEHCPGASRQKTISDFLAREVVRLDAEWVPDVIESSDYLFPLHTYLQMRQTGAASARAPVVVFNHGLLQDVYPASGLMPGDWAWRELVYEEQVVRWADLVLAPSEAAARRIARLIGDAGRVRLVREPFAAVAHRPAGAFPAGDFLYCGRVSFAKGVDRIAPFLNMVRGQWPVERLTLLGRPIEVPFRRRDPVELLRSRLHPELRPAVRSVGPCPSQDVPEHIRGHGFFLNFSRSETFSFTTLEAIAQGVVPIVMRDTPMAEMIPPEYRDRGTLSRPPAGSTECLDVLRFWESHYDEALPRMQDFAEKEFSYSCFAESYRGAIAPRPAHPRSARKARYSGNDVTVLISTKDDSDLLREAVISVLRQTERPAEILVLDDGSTQARDIEQLDRFAESGAIRLLRRPNMGLVAGRQVLIENASTDLVIFLDADDLLAETYVERTVAAMNVDPDGLSGVMTYRKNFGDSDHGSRCFLLGMPQHWCANDFRMTSLLKRSACLRLGFDPDMTSGEADDWHFWLRFSVHGYKATMVPEFLFQYRVRSDSMSTRWSEGQGALTVAALQRVVAEAADHGVELSPALHAAVFAAYSRRWQRDLAWNRIAELEAAAAHAGAWHPVGTRSLVRRAARLGRAALSRLFSLAPGLPRPRIKA